MIQLPDLHTLSAQFFPDQPVEVIEQLKHDLSKTISWQRIRIKATHQEFGLAVNAITFPARSLTYYRPKLEKKGDWLKLPSSRVQAEIAHAYWQTVWAGGAIRQERGSTFPVAFFPLDRFSKQVGDQQVYIKKLSEKQYLVGQQAYVQHLLKKVVKRGKVVFNGEKFRIKASPFLEKLLNFSAFVDQFIGNNQRLSFPIHLNKIVFYSASHRLSTTWDEQRQNVSPHYLALCNAGYFLNFPEEYLNQHTAMNDLVSLAIENGDLLQAPLLKRACLLVANDGSVAIKRIGMEHVQIKLPWLENYLIFERDFLVNPSQVNNASTIVYTPSYHANKPFGEQHTPLRDCIDFVISFGRIVEIRRGGGTAIPESGFVLSIPDLKKPMRSIVSLIKRFGNRVHLRLKDDNIAFAFSAGPYLLENGQTISDEFFGSHLNEDFYPADFSAEMLQKGVPPTRFPHDVAETRAPRLFLCTDNTNNCILCLIDGRNDPHSKGATLIECAQLAKTCGAISAINLDGGGSAVLALIKDFHQEFKIDSHVPDPIVNLPSDYAYNDRLMPLSIGISE